MGIYSYDTEIKSPVPRERMFNAYALDGDNLIPKLAPHEIKGCEILEGDGGPGTIKKFTFAEGHKMKFMKHKVDAIDKEHFKYDYSVIDGDVLEDKYEKISHESKFEESPDGGCVVKTTSKFFLKEHAHVKEEHFMVAKEKFHGLFRAIGDHLVHHPKEYC